MQEESTFAILLLVVLALLTFWVAYILKVFKVTVFHESLFSVLLGMLVGLILEKSKNFQLEKLVTFNHSYFFNILLPPIILNSGYELDVAIFIKHINPILMFAFVGTFVSSIGIGILVYVFHTVFSLKITLVESIMFGSILSSTDPVTVLGIFKTLKVDHQLYSIIVGESMLNDAVSIVLFSSLNNFNMNKSEMSDSLFTDILGNFLVVFFGSTALGIALALLTSLTTKYSSIHKYPHIESCIVTLAAYAAYLFSQIIEMSGIVTLLFCGVTMKHYTFSNLSLSGRKTVKSMCRVMSNLCEIFIFIFLGITIFTKQRTVFNWGFIIFTFISILLGRALGVFPISWLINFLDRIRFKPNFGCALENDFEKYIKFDEQVIMWWAGLRGAISFALSMDMSSKAYHELGTTVLVVVVLSIIILGGSTSALIKRMKIKTRNENVQPRDVYALNYQRTHWFSSFDNKYLLP
jgi:sodium/hydrogen exchanger-like protein 6/7